MPKYKQNWEADYHDPISDEEDRRQAELEEQLNAEIMAEIELCRRMEDDEEFAEKVRREAEMERALYYDLDEAEDQYWEDLADEDHRYWQEHSGR